MVAGSAAGDAPGQGRVASASGGGSDASHWPLSVGGGDRMVTAGAGQPMDRWTGLLRILF